MKNLEKNRDMWEGLFCLTISRRTHQNKIDIIYLSAGTSDFKSLKVLKSVNNRLDCYDQLIQNVIENDDDKANANLSLRPYAILKKISVTGFF